MQAMQRQWMQNSVATDWDKDSRWAQRVSHSDFLEKCHDAQLSTRCDCNAMMLSNQQGLSGQTAMQHKLGSAQWAAWGANTGTKQLSHLGCRVLFHNQVHKLLVSEVLGQVFHIHSHKLFAQ